MLLVEDDPAIAGLYAFKLRRDGFQVSLAGDRAEAERAFAQETPDVVLADARLPGGGGTELAGTFIDAGARVILLTNDQRAHDRPPAGVALSLIKARTSPTQLSAAIRKLLAG